MKALPILLSLLVAGCCTCPPKTSVTVKPNITPVQESNKQIRASSKKIKASGEQSLKYNKDIQGDLNSAEQELNNLLKK